MISLSPPYNELLFRLVTIFSALFQSTPYSNESKKNLLAGHLPVSIRQTGIAYHLIMVIATTVVYGF